MSTASIFGALAVLIATVAAARFFWDRRRVVTHGNYTVVGCRYELASRTQAVPEQHPLVRDPAPTIKPE